MRRFARRTLERAGFQVTEARDGQEAIDVYRSEGDRLDAVVLDMSMPRIGGSEAFRELRKLDDHVPVLFTSGYDPAAAAGSLASSYAVRFLQKPFRPAALTREVTELLREARSAGPATE